MVIETTVGGPEIDGSAQVLHEHIRPTNRSLRPASVFRLMESRDAPVMIGLYRFGYYLR